jgi:hypothetical protein
MILALLGVLATMLVAGDTPIGRSLHRWLVEKPAARLARISRVQVAVVLLLAATGAGAFWLLGHEGLQLFGMMAPELTGLLASVEVMGLLDAAITVALIASSVRWNAVRTAVIPRLRGSRTRARRTRRAERPTPANDDEDPAELRLVA